MPAPTFEYHDDYYSINTGAHRKGGLALDAPTLASHLGLWFPRNPALLGSKRSVRVNGLLVDAHVASLYAAMRGLAGFTCNFQFEVDGVAVLALFGGSYVAAAAPALQPFVVTKSPAHFVLRDAKDSDNRILLLKGDWDGLGIIVRCEFHSEYFTITRTATITNLERLPTKLGPLARALKTLAKTAAGDAMSVEECHAYLYRDVWQTLDNELFLSQDLYMSGPLAKPCTLFADFRGLVLTGQGSGMSLAGVEHVPEQGRPFAEDWPLQTLLPSLWPFLTVEKGLDLKRREFTASFMLKKRAVYITALGPQPPADSAFARAPLNYLLVARPISDWQLGTLVDRLHYMGTLRLAGLMELQALRLAGANLRAMEHEAEAARAALDADDLAGALRHYQNGQDLIAHTGPGKQPIFWEGLQFRVERSRYYVNRFKEFVPFLEMGSIDGFQQYDHFVWARLGGNYDYINRLGLRQERAVSSIAGSWQAISLKEDARIARTIEKLQTKAEIALLAVIVPHYAMDIIHALQDAAEHSTTTFQWYKALLVVGGILALSSFCVYLLDTYRQRGTRRLVGTLLKYACLSVVAVGTGLAIVHYRVW